MMQKNSKLLLTAVMLLLILSSCDLFFIGPSLNINWDDPNAGFGRLDAEQIGKDEIRVSWDWYDIERRLRGGEAVFDEIVIKHNKNNRPLSRFGGTSFEIKNWNSVTNPMWSAEFDDLEKDEEYYFALYAHEKDGRWLAPVYTSVYLENTYSEMRTLYSDTNTEAFGASIITGSTGGTGSITNDLADVYFFRDVRDDERIVEAILNIEIAAGGGPVTEDKVLIYPLRLYTDGSKATLDPGVNIDELTLDRTMKEELALTAGEDGVKTIDITDVFAKSQYHRTYGILMVLPSDSTNSVDFTLPFTINLEVVRRNY